jgi:hypothetical protein
MKLVRLIKVCLSETYEYSTVSVANIFPLHSLFINGLK